MGDKLWRDVRERGEKQEQAEKEKKIRSEKDLLSEKLKVFQTQCNRSPNEILNDLKVVKALADEAFEQLVKEQTK